MQKKGKNKMGTLSSGFYIENGKKNQKFIIEWSTLSALSEEFADKMSSLAGLGIESFRSVEIDFLSAYPQALKEDKSLVDFIGLKGKELEDSMNVKLHQIFHTRPENFSEGMRSFLTDAYYIFVTIKDESFEKVQGFITFMTGGPIPAEEFKITVLAVDKDARQQGLAGYLINSLKKIGSKTKKVLVCTRPSNTVAIKAYKKLGFVEDFEGQRNAPQYLIKGHWIHLVRYDS